MNTSCSMPRSRAEGVRIVFGPMKIFSLRVIARRHVVFADEGEISTAGFGGRFGFWQRSCIAPAFGEVCT